MVRNYAGVDVNAIELRFRISNIIVLRVIRDQNAVRKNPTEEIYPRQPILDVRIIISSY